MINLIVEVVGPLDQLKLSTIGTALPLVMLLLSCHLKIPTHAVMDLFAHFQWDVMEVNQVEHGTGSLSLVSQLVEIMKIMERGTGKILLILPN